jgi:glycosyltransferase involved in cell wall biosynthesis
MKILHVNAGLSGGGVEQYLTQVLDEIAKRGHQNIILHGDQSFQKSHLEDHKVFAIEDVTNLHCQNLNRKTARVQSLLEEESPDLIFIHQVFNSPLIDFLTRRLPSVRFVHDLKLICPDGRKILKNKKQTCTYPLGFACQTRAYRFKCMPRNPVVGLPLIYHLKKIARIHRSRSYLVVASQFMKSVLLYNGFKEQKIEVIPYFTDFTSEPSQAAQRQEPVLLAVGRIVKEKGIHILLRAFSKLPSNIRLLIAGDGPDISEMKKYSEKLEISSRVSFLGWMDHHQIGKVLRSCSLVVVPSIWPEPFGIVGIEAMASSKPVVAFDSGGIRDWLHDGVNGFLIRVGDEELLVKKLKTLVDNPQEAHKMGQVGRDIVKSQFVAEVHLNHLLSLVQRARSEYCSRNSG